MKKQLIIFTDLDGTLLDADTYSFSAALNALAMINESHIPLIICSSKTRVEIEHYRLLLGNDHPFISENGGGIFIPLQSLEFAGYLDKRIENIDNYHLIRLGASYANLRQGIKTLREKGFDIKGFGDMTANEISSITGLTAEESLMAKQREFDEPFLFRGDMNKLNDLLTAVNEMGFNVTEGAFFHLLGDSDKGRAVSILADIYNNHFSETCSIALGDSPNDLPMLRSVDIPVIVRKKNREYDTMLSSINPVLADGIGPEGWSRAIHKILRELG